MELENLEEKIISSPQEKLTQSGVMDERDRQQSTVESFDDHSLQLSSTDDASDIRDASSNLSHSHEGLTENHENSGRGSLTENESDEIHDTQSVISDTSMSFLSHQAQPRASYEKLITQVKKLKKENISLKDLLNQANLNDITMLKTKLRGAQADLLRYRQLNIELKERIQLLEEKQFRLLSESKATENEETTEQDYSNNNEDNDHQRTTPGTTRREESISEKLKKQFQQKRKNPSSLPSSSSRIHDVQSSYPPVNPSPEKRTLLTSEEASDPTSSSSAPTGNYVSEWKAMQAKLKHSEKLIRIYEKNMSMMQNEIDQLKASKIAASSTSSSEGNNTNGHHLHTQQNLFEDRRSGLHQGAETSDSTTTVTASSFNHHHQQQKTVDFHLDEDKEGNSKQDFTAAKETTTTTATGTASRKQLAMSREMKLLLEEYRASDQKTIKELAREVKRLSRLIPRRRLEESNSVNGEEHDDETAGNERLVEVPSSSGASSSSSFSSSSSPSSSLTNHHPSKTTPNPSNHSGSQSKEDQAERSVPLKRTIEGIESHYSFSHLLVSFCLGSLLMIFWLWRYLPT